MNESSTVVGVPKEGFPKAETAGKELGAMYNLQRPFSSESLPAVGPTNLPKLPQSPPNSTNGGHIFETCRACEGYIRLKS